MYGFLLNMWIMKKINEDYVRRCVPKFLTEDEANMILATPQEEQ